MPQQMASSRNDRLSVVDVYDVAASIGKEFEKIIDNHGPDAVTDLMPKVIHVLEHLEELTAREQDEGGELEDLKFTVERLQAEKAAKAEEREKYEKELEQIEASWQSETQDLMKTMTRLQEENRRLRSTLKEKEGDAQNQKDSLDECAVVIELKEKMHTMRNRTRSLERELNQKNLDIDAMQGQIERLARLNADIRHKTSISNQRAQGLIQEQVDLEAQLHDKDQEIAKIREKMKDGDLNSPPVRLSPYVFEAQLSDSTQSKLPAASTTVTKPTLSPDDITSIQDKLERQGKVVYDSSDPNRPRFTMNELRDVLQERNDLKSKLIDVEQELEQYKPPPEEDQGPESPIDLDAPVQGPINREPDEKLYPERYGRGGIRKFFRFLLSPSNSSSRDNSPRNTKRRSISRPPDRNMKQLASPNFRN